MKIKLMFINDEEVQYEIKESFEQLTKKTVDVLSAQGYLNERVKIIPNPFLEFGFLTSKDIESLNLEHRNIGKTTDVLSFSFIEKLSDYFPTENLIGQIFMDYEVVQKQALTNQWSIKDELELLFVHGLLHVFGFDHLKKNDFEKMFGIHLQIQNNPQVEGFIEKLRKEFD